MEPREKELPFLDILIKRNHHKIWMDFYFKPGDIRRVSRSYPAIRTIVQKTPFPLARRTCTIVENQQQKLRHLPELKEKIKNITTTSI